MRFIFTLLATLALSVATIGRAETPTEGTAKAPPKDLIGGDYKVTAITPMNDGGFRVEFTAVASTGVFDVLTLSTDHVHVAVKVGQTLRLSAQILSASGKSAEVAQMVVFFPSAGGRTPVWLLSNRAPNQDLRATKYLEMHAPSTDFVVM